MSHFTHICKCGHARENHGSGEPGSPCATGRVIPCGCRGLDVGPSILRETFVPGWEGHAHPQARRRCARTRRRRKPSPSSASASWVEPKGRRRVSGVKVTTGLEVVR